MVISSTEFRGKRTGTNIWVYGDLLVHSGKEIRISNEEGVYVVNKNTVGPFIGLYDIDGQKIFAGDILDTPRWVVTYCANVRECYGMQAGWYIQRDDFESWEELSNIESHKVLGNIYDNPELMKK